MRSLAIVALSLVLSCATPTPPSGGQDSGEVAPGVIFGRELVGSGVIRLSLDNGTREPVGYNLCSSTLQRRDGGSWTDVATDEVCTAEIRSLNPGHDATFEKRLPAGLVRGDYRYRTRVEIPFGTPAQVLVTPSFTAP